MFETPQDLSDLQGLLDASYARAGDHLRSIWGEETRLDAEAVSEELAGVQVLDLATVTPNGEPRVAPVDGLFFRARFWFGSAENSVRFRNIRANPAVSAVVTRGPRNRPRWVPCRSAQGAASKATAAASS